MEIRLPNSSNIDLDFSFKWDMKMVLRKLDLDPSEVMWGNVISSDGRTYVISGSSKLKVHT